MDVFCEVVKRRNSFFRYYYIVEGVSLGQHINDLVSVSPLQNVLVHFVFAARFPPDNVEGYVPDSAVVIQRVPVVVL